jgi:hypothetical protein
MVSKNQLTKASKEVATWTNIIANMNNLLDNRKTLTGKIRYVQGLIKKLNEANGLIQMTVGNHLDDVLVRLQALPKPEKKKREMKPKKTSLKKYIRILNYLFTHGKEMYKIPVIKTIDNSENTGTLAYCLSIIFPEIVNYNIYKMSTEQNTYILKTIENYITYISEDEFHDILSNLDINEVVRTFPSKPSQAKLPILNDIMDIQTAYGYIANASLSQEEYQEDPLQEEDYPVVEINENCILYSKQSHIPLPKKTLSQKILSDDYEYEFFHTIEALPKPQQPKRRIPKYVPTENYKDQKDVYSGYDTYGSYKSKLLVFESATQYISDLEAFRLSGIDTNEFIDKIKAQQSNLKSSVLFDYLYNILSPIHRRQYDISLIYDENNTQLVEEDDIITQQIEDIDHMCDILARAQYSLDKDRYKQFLVDLSAVLLGQLSKQAKMDIVKNFYIEYKFISADNMHELIDKYTIISYDELIAEADKYIHNILFEKIQKENREREKKENEYHNELYFKEEREREERENKVYKKADKKMKKSK